MNSKGKEKKIQWGKSIYRKYREKINYTTLNGSISSWNITYICTLADKHYYVKVERHYTFEVRCTPILHTMDKQRHSIYIMIFVFFFVKIQIS